MRNLLLPLLAVSLFLSSCLSRKETVLLQKLNKAEKYSDTYQYNFTTYVLRPGDAVGLEVFAVNPKTMEELKSLVKQNSANMNMMQQGGGNDLYYLQGYVIDDSNYIELPMLGKMKVGGKTLDGAQKTIQAKISEYYRDVFIKINFGGIRYTILGEINLPGKYTVLQSRLNLFEVLAMSGDFRDFAKRDKVKIIRTTTNGSEIVEVNLLDRNIMKSPYFFIQTNDIIYVEPMSRKFVGFGTNAVQGFTTAISVLTSTLLIIQLFN